MGKNVEKIKNMLDGIIDPSNRRIRVGWVPGKEENSAKLEDREKRRNKSDVLSTARMPIFCPKCNRVMKKRLDDKSFDELFEVRERKNPKLNRRTYKWWEEESTKLEDF